MAGSSRKRLKVSYGTVTFVKCKARLWSSAPSEVLGLGTHISDEMLPCYEMAVERVYDLLDVHPTPATHSILTSLKVGESVSDIFSAETVFQAL